MYTSNHKVRGIISVHWSKIRQRIHWVQLRALDEATKRMTILQLVEEAWEGKKLDKRVPHELSDNKKHNCFEMSSILRVAPKNDPFLDRIRTFNEKGIFYVNRMRFHLGVSPPPRTTTLSETAQKKVMVSI